jgi:hypothetical protein
VRLAKEQVRVNQGCKRTRTNPAYKRAARENISTRFDLCFAVQKNLSPMKSKFTVHQCLANSPLTTMPRNLVVEAAPMLNMGAHERLCFRARTCGYGVVPTPQVLTFRRYVQISPFTKIDCAQRRRIGDGVAFAGDKLIVCELSIELAVEPP